MNKNTQQITEIYQETLFLLKGREENVKMRVEFYPYVKINNTIRLREGIFQVKISDILHDAPLSFHRVLAEILLRKFYRKRVSPQLMKSFQDYVNQPDLRQKSIASRKERGRKIFSGAQGTYYNLEKIFDLLNQKNFQNTISKPVLTWSAHKTYRILGRYDPAHHTITISKTLDDERIPPFVVMYVVFHEMLHIKHPTEYKNGRHSIHTPAFRREEESFELFESAEDWIEKNWGDFAKGKRKRTKGKKGILRNLFNF